MSRKSNQAVKTVSLMMIITLFGKILGLVREQFLAANYADGMAAAAFLTASRIPRTFFDVVFASAISASFIPIFNEYLEKKGKKEAFLLANRFITLIAVVTIGIMILGMIFAEPLVWLFAPMYDAETAELSVNLSRVLFPTILFTGIAFSFVGILQSLDEFNIPAALSVASNGIIILYYIFFNERFGVYGLTIAFLVGWSMQALIQLPALWKKGYFYRPNFGFWDEGIKRIAVLMLPVMVSTWVQPINFMINSRFASYLYDGKQGVAVIEYANTLYTIIVGVFVLAIANLIFPRLSRISGDVDKEEFGHTIQVTLRSMLFLLVPMMVGLMALSQPLVRLIYQRGDFSAMATELTATALLFFSLGMIGYGVQAILSRAFYANQNGRMPFISGVISIIINGVLCRFLLEPMGVGGLALASAVSSTAAAFILFVPTVKKYTTIINKTFIVSCGKMVLSSAFMLLVVLVSYNFLAERVGESLLGQLVCVGVPTCTGFMVYMILTAVLKVEEGQVLFTTISRCLYDRGENEGVGAQARETWKGYLNMTEKIADVVEDSFCFSTIERVIQFVVRLWMESLIYSGYKWICEMFRGIFSESGILNAFRADWDGIIGVGRETIPGRWRHFVGRCADTVREKGSLSAATFAESAILRIFDQRFLVLCLCAIVFGIPILPTMLLVLLCLGTYIVYMMNLFLGRVKTAKTSLVSICLGLFGVCIIYGSFTSYNFPKALMVMAVFLVFMGIFFVARDVIDTDEKLNLVLLVMIGTGVWIALYAIFQYITGVEMDKAWVDAESFDIQTRAYATFSNPNVLGEYLIIIGSLAAGMIWKTRRWTWKIFYAGCFAVLCVGLLATNSRGAMLGLILAAGLFVLLAEKRLIPLGIAGLAAMPFVLPASLWSRLISSITMSDSSSLYRMSIYKAGMDMIDHYSLTGIGMDAFNEIYPLFSYEAANAYHVHNLFLQTFIELGIVGFAILILLVIFFFQRSYSAMGRMPFRFRALQAAVFGGFAGILLQGMTDHIWFDYSIMLLFWCFMGIGMASARVGERAWQKEE